MAIVREQYATSYTTSNASPYKTFGSLVKTGSLLLLLANVDAAQGPELSVSDDRSNTWYEVYEQNWTTTHFLYMAYAPNAAAGSTTVTLHIDSANNEDARFVIVEISGIATSSPLDQSNYSGGTYSAAWDSGNISTTQADEYLIGLAQHDGLVTMSEDGAFDLIYEEESGASLALSVAERIVSSTLTESYSGTLSGSATWAAAIASFKGAATPSGVSPQLVHQRRMRAA